jgi:hypothetical protein
MTSADLPALRFFSASHTRIWLVYSHNWYTDPSGLVPRNLGQAAELTDDKAFASRGPIAVFLYERRPQAQRPSRHRHARPYRLSFGGPSEFPHRLISFSQTVDACAVDL